MGRLDTRTSYAVLTWPGSDDHIASVNTGVRSGAELQGTGIVLDPGRQSTMGGGDFWSPLFILEAATPRLPDD